MIRITPHLWIAEAIESLRTSARTRRKVGGTAIIVFGICTMLYYFTAPPTNFIPVNALRIESGTPSVAVARELSDAHVIAHPEILRLILHVTGTTADVQAGVYHFNTPQNLLTVAYRLVSGGYGFPPVRMTFIEGETVHEMAQQIASSTLDIAAPEFIAAAKSKEGYLFPDTYFLQPSATVQSIVDQLHKNFTDKIEPLLPDIDASKHSLSDIITMASLVEKEARTTKDRKIIADILWNRIARGMPLQVDAVFGYINNRPTYSPSYADLKVNSPYNTYTHKGLPPGPICNPGLDAIEAAIHPTKTSYLYYLTGKDGVMRYAQTYAQQLANQRRYL